MSYLELFESETERANRAVVASRCATTWRDANARKRGERFKLPVFKDDSVVTERVKRNGDKIKFRGGGFYSGMKRGV